MPRERLGQAGHAGDHAYVTPDVFRIVLSNPTLSLPISGTSPKTCSKSIEMPKKGTRSPPWAVPRAGLLRGGPNPLPYP